MLVEAVLDYVSQPVFIYQLMTSLTAYYGIMLIRFYMRRHRRHQLLRYYGYPGPKPTLLDGNSSMYFKNHRIFEVEMENFKKYGPTWCAYHGDSPSIITTEPALLKHVFLEAFDTFSERVRPLMKIKMTSGILFCPRPKWKFFRKMLAIPFNKFTARGQASVLFVEDSVKMMIEYIDNKIDNAKSNGTRLEIDIYDLLKANALYMISELAMKLKVQVKEKEINVQQLDAHLKHSDGPLFRLGIMFPFFMTIMTWIIETFQVEGYMRVIYKALDDRLSSTSKKINEDLKKGITTAPDDEPIIDTLIRNVYFNQMTHREYHGNAEALLFAGYDTTSTTLVYTLWCLSKHQDVQDRLREELLTEGTDSKYLDQVLNESMRLYPVVASFTIRLATKSSEFDGRIIPEGTVIVFNNYIMHRNPVYWKDPEQFDPERFAPGKVIDPIYFAPFGLGERKCLGAKLAILEMKIILTELILRYKLTLESPQDLQMETCGFSITKPADPIHIQFEKRI